MIYDEITGFPLGDPAVSPFPPDYTPNWDVVTESYKRLILSASGWRMVFSADGDEESREPSITHESAVLVAVMAAVYIRFLREIREIREKSESRKASSLNEAEGPTVVVGCDSRYTGPTIADIMIRVLITEGAAVRYLFITAAPEIMAYTKLEREIDGFIYISASHNPIGHNGVKFGFSDGAVIGGQDSQRLISQFRKMITETNEHENVEALLNRLSGTAGARLIEDRLSSVYRQTPERKEEAKERYRFFSKRVVSGSEAIPEQDRFFSYLRENTTVKPIGVVGELNGSARTLSIDKEFLRDAGIKTKIVNGNPRDIVHAIVPEGESLDLCREVLEACAGKDNSFLFGYVPDNDGDRGNIVLMDHSTGKAETLDAQQVFALVCTAELAFLTALGLQGNKTAVAVNGPTSLRIEEIARVFQAEVFRSETGEANVVNLAGRLRDEGYIVRILGEGSNGGNITHPATVRDPLNTLFAFLKMLLMRGDPSDKGPSGAASSGTSFQKGLFRMWCERAGQPRLYTDDFTLNDVITSLPNYSTTPTTDKRAKLRITTADHSRLKERYLAVFRREFPANRDRLKEEFGFHSWIPVLHTGTDTIHGEDAIEEYKRKNSGNLNGGLKVLFTNADGRENGFIWMRGSGTEPVFRVLADIEGADRQREERLLEWHTKMVKKADQKKR